MSFRTTGVSRTSSVPRSSVIHPAAQRTQLRTKQAAATYSQAPRRQTSDGSVGSLGSSFGSVSGAVARQSSIGLSSMHTGSQRVSPKANSSSRPIGAVTGAPTTSKQEPQPPGMPRQSSMRTTSTSGTGTHASRMRKAVASGTTYSRDSELDDFSHTSSQGLSSTSSTDTGCDEITGLDNLGNTCFMNATIQCLMKLALMRHFLASPEARHSMTRVSGSTGSIGQNRRGSGKRLTLALMELAERMRSVKSGSVAPTNVKLCIGSYVSTFSGYDQHDAQEFLRFLLDKVHDEVNRVEKRPPYQELKDVEGETERETAMRYFKYHTDRDNSAVTDIFSGMFHNCLKCNSCGHVSHSFDPFLDLSVSIPKGGRSSGSTSLEDCLRLYTGVSNLPEIKCGKCKKISSGQQWSRIYKPPKVLVIHLKRFGNMGRSKLNDKVSFPIDDFDLSEFISPSSGRIPAEATTYMLRGVVNHKGSPYGGHYTSYCRAGMNAFYEFNDSMATPVTPSSVVSPAAYLLFFEAHDVAAMMYK